MNYLLVHIGTQLPSYIVECINQILFIDSRATIYLCTDQETNHISNEVVIVNINTLTLPSLHGFFQEDSNPLWWTSLYRIFIINSFLNEYQISGIVHFDNDVLIYKDFSELLPMLSNEVYVTPHTNTEFTFGFSYINNKEKYNIICDNIYNIILQGEDTARHLTGDQIHEMRLLHYSGKNYITPLPVHPSLGNISNSIFDPSSYGQFFGGTHSEGIPGYTENSHIVGPLIRNTQQDLYFDNGHPKIIYESIKYDIANLHIHSKNLSNFITYNK